MPSDNEFMCNAEEYVRLAGLTDDLIVRDQLLNMAQGWMAAAQQKRRTDAERRTDGCVILLGPQRQEAAPGATPPGPQNGCHRPDGRCAAGCGS